MANSNYHGNYSFEGKNVLCSMQSFNEERYGRFGRMFRNLPPLYVTPSYLSLLGKLGGPMDGGAVPQYTNNTPLGMVYFGQFIDHDITFDTQTNFSSINNPVDVVNTRTAELDLDCVFGGGPADEPFMYGTRSDGFYLLTGKTNKNVEQGENKEKHDLARTGKGVAIIGDPRNDENRVLSQFQLAVIRFYNAVYFKIKNDPKTSNLGPDAIYKMARKQVTWHYQWIIVNEFLPLICGQKVVNDVLGNGRKFYTPQHGGFIPVEFSIAAYRFGHSMIDQNLKLQIGGAIHSIFSPEFGFGFSKITNKNQVIDWEVMFDFNGDFQKAEKLDTTLASTLLSLPIPVVDSINADDKSLATRNLRRGQSFLLPSGENVAAFMGIDETTVATVKKFIVSKTAPHGIDFSAGTPLWYYILSEAESIGRIESDNTNTPGEGLGPVGARIVAEVLIGLLELDTNSYLGNNRDWTPDFDETKKTFYMKDLLTIAQSAVEL